MTVDDEDLSMAAIETARTLNRSLAAKVREHGVSVEDVTIAGLYSAFDLASEFTGSRPDGLAWLRRALDVVEQQITAEGTVQ